MSEEKIKEEKSNAVPSGKCEKRVCAVGGEALMEGILMRGPSGYAQVIRSPEGELLIETKRQAPFGAGNKFLSFPLVRGTVRLADSLIVGTKALFNSAEVTATGDDPNYKPSKFDLWVEEKLGDKAMGVVMTLSLILALAIAIGLFFVLPLVIVWGLEQIPGFLSWSLIPGMPGWPLKQVIEGIVRMLLFVGYLALVSNMKDIKRVFMYHGAEHKTIFCYENYEELTVENVRKQSKHHPRCGTAFLFVVMIISIFIHSLLPDFRDILPAMAPIVPILLNVLARLLTLPIIAGIAYEFNRYAGSHENRLVKVLRAPGLFMQRFTTKEPDDSMIELAIVALNEALKLDEAPDYSARSAPEPATDGSGENAASDANDESAGEAGAAGTDDLPESSADPAADPDKDPEPASEGN
ncbi:MAG: DUF1385 domain-containing protein [Clostridia bacterium]|nr:DUF1385 domain-containing protein [Clostridia bacterium]